MGKYSNIEANIIPIQPLTGHQYIRIQNSLNVSDCEGLVTNSVSDLLINIKKVKLWNQWWKHKSPAKQITNRKNDWNHFQFTFMINSPWIDRILRILTKLDFREGHSKSQKWLFQPWAWLSLTVNFRFKPVSEK